MSEFHIRSGEVDLPTGWVTVDFRPGAAGTATLVEDGETREARAIVGWLVEEQYAVDPATGNALAVPFPVRRVVPGYLGPDGSVVRIDQLPVDPSRGSNDVRWVVRAGAAPDTTVNVQVEPAPVHVEVIAPRTRKVVRDQHGEITKIVEES